MHHKNTFSSSCSSSSITLQDQSQNPIVINHQKKQKYFNQKLMGSMGSSELIKSILIMAGIPLAFCVSCSLLARSARRKNSSLPDETEEMKFDCMGCDDEDDIAKDGDENRLKEQIFILRNKIEELQELEREIEIRFFRFIDLKDQEYALMEVQNSLLVEKERAEFLERELTSMEEEQKKFDEMVIEYLKALGELESSRLENGLLRRREKKLLKKTRESWRLIRRQNLKIEAREAEMLHNKIELKRKEVVIQGLELQVEEMRDVITQMKNEKNEVLNKLQTAENEVASKVDAERVLMENYNRVVNELQDLQKDRAGELKELVYLRWCHACLRHELARRKEPEQERKSDQEKIDHEHGLGFDRNIAPEESIRHELENVSVVDHDDSFLRPPEQPHRKRRWLLRRFKKLVDGNEKNHQTKCFESQSVVDEAEERHSPGRKSFSSV